MSLSLNDNVDETTRALLVQSSQVEQAKKEAFRRGEQIYNEIGTLQDTVIENTAIVNQVQNAGKLKTEQATLRAANVAGVDPSAGMDDLTKMIAQRKVLADEALKKFDEYTTYSVFNIPGRAIAKKDAREAAERLAIVDKNLQGTNQLVQNTAQTYRTITESITATSAQAATNIATAALRIQQKKDELEGLKYNTLGVQASMEATKEQLSALYNQKSAKQSEVQLDLALRNADRQTAEFAFRQDEAAFSRRMREEALTAKKEGTEYDESLLAKINYGRSVRGLTPIDSREAKGELQLFKTGASKKFAMDYEIGDVSQSLGVPILGLTPANALQTLESSNTQVVSSRGSVVELFQSVKSQVAKDPIIAGSKDPAAFASAFNKKMKENIDTEFGNVRPNGVFDIGDLKSYLGNAKDPQSGIADLKALPFSQKVLLPAIEQGVPLTDPKIILGLGVAAVSQGTITSSEFQDLSNIYQKANLINQQSKNFLGLGIVLPSNGMQYNAKVTTYGAPIDLTDPTTLGLYLTREMAGAKWKSAFGMPVVQPTTPVTPGFESRKK